MSSPDIQKERPSISFHKYYDGVFVVVKKEIFRVFLWLYQGGPEYVGDFLKTTPRGMKRLRAIEKNALARKDLPVSFDIPFLYTILKHTCGLAEDIADIWNKPMTPEEQSSLEHTLYLLKEKRNEVSHKANTLMHMTQEDLETHFKELRRLCSLIIREAGQKSNRSTTEVDLCVAQMERSLEDIKTKPAPSGFTAKKFALVCKQEMIKYHNPSPSSSTFVMPLLHSNGKTGRYEMTLRNFPLWRCDDGSQPLATILQGDIGNGKTSICGYIFDSWVSYNADIYDLQDFDLVVPVQCCKVSTRDLLEFLKEFIGETMSLCNKEEVSKFLASLRILWLIDGFEEATKDAIELLKKIEKQATSSSSSSHLMFITTKPQRHQDLVDDILVSKNKLCEVSLSGLSEEGVMLLITNYLHEKEKDLNICKTKGKQFMADVRSHGKDILMELRIPLKLKLMIELWLDGKLHKGSGASLRLLYETIMDVHTERLKEKTRIETKLKESEIQSRINSWVKSLCKVAFEMTMQKKFVKITPNYKRQIEKAAEPFSIYPEDCLSIFLQSERLEASDCPSSYSFVHSSQQFYLSGRHVLSLVECDNRPAKLLWRLFKEKISQNPLDTFFYYQVLLHLVSSTAMQQSLEQSLAKVLIKLLSMCSEFNAFEVVQYAAYSPVLVKEVSKFTDGNWTVIDHNIKAAMTLLQFVTPLVIQTEIVSDPNDLKDLHEFLEIVSRRKMKIFINLLFQYLTFPCNSFSDRYLAPIYSSDAKCHLWEFYGKLSIEGSKILLKMSEVKTLALNVSSNELLGNILSNLKYLNKLEVLFLTLFMPVVTTPSSSLHSKTLKSIIHLQMLDDSQVEETSLSLTQMYNHYDEIILSDISAAAATKFIQMLQQKDVKVNSIIRDLKVNPHNQHEYFIINYGPVPLNRPIPIFYDQWHNTYVKISEDDLGMKRPKLVTQGIPPSDVLYFDCSSLSDVKLFRFF